MSLLDAGLPDIGRIDTVSSTYILFHLTTLLAARDARP
jgi:hypothetical protein